MGRYLLITAVLVVGCTLCVHGWNMVMVSPHDNGGCERCQQPFNARAQWRRPLQAVNDVLDLAGSPFSLDRWERTFPWSPFQDVFDSFMDDSWPWRNDRLGQHNGNCGSSRPHGKYNTDAESGYGSYGEDYDNHFANSHAYPSQERPGKYSHYQPSSSNDRQSQEQFKCQQQRNSRAESERKKASEEEQLRQREALKQDLEARQREALRKEQEARQRDAVKREQEAKHREALKREEEARHREALRKEEEAKQREALKREQELREKETRLRQQKILERQQQEEEQRRQEVQERRRLWAEQERRQAEHERRQEDLRQLEKERQRQREQQYKARNGHPHNTHSRFQHRDSFNDKAQQRLGRPLVEAQVQGYYPSELKLKSVGHSVHVTGVHACGCEDNCVMREFERNYKLPENTDTESLTATLDPEGQLVIYGQQYRYQVPAIDSSIPIDGIQGLPHVNPNMLNTDCLRQKSGLKLSKIDSRTGKAHDKHAIHFNRNSRVTDPDDDVTIEVADEYYH